MLFRHRHNLCITTLRLGVYFVLLYSGTNHRAFCLAQDVVPLRHKSTAASCGSDFPLFSSATLYWDDRCISGGSPVAVWFDAIQHFAWRQPTVASQPTLDATGLHFDGVSQGMYLNAFGSQTNCLQLSRTLHTVIFVLHRDASAQTLQRFLCESTTCGGAAGEQWQFDTGSFGSGNNLEITRTSGGEMIRPTTPALLSVVWNVSDKFYTNGVASTAPFAGGDQWNAGFLGSLGYQGGTLGGSNDFYRGYIEALVILTNKTLTVSPYAGSDVSNIYFWTTNFFK